jgi:phosphoribosylanthranilate isomerase
MNHKIKLKVCGMRDPENILQVSQLQPDYMGFIFYSKSPRFVNEHFTIPENLSSSIKRVGVFVNQSTEKILQKIKLFHLDYIQLHGHETIEQIEELKSHNIKIIKAFSVDDEFNFNVTVPYQPAVDFFLFDTKGKYYGGNATPFNWGVLRKYNQSVPFFLSGGLNASNIIDLSKLNDMNLHALDVNSGVEISAGMKNPEQLKAIQDILNINI